MDTQLCVLGGGPGGYAAAFLAADLGMQVTLVDLEPRLGGICLLRGCIPSKALLHVAKAMAEARHLAEWGVSFPKPPDRSGRHAGPQGKGHRHAHRRAEADRRQAQSEGRPGPGRFRGLADAAAASRSAARRWPTTACASRTASWPAVRGPTRIPAFDLPTPRVMDSTGALGTGRRARVAAGRRRRLHRPGNGHRLRRPGQRVTVVELTDGLLPGADRDLVRPLHKKLSKDFAGDPAGHEGRFPGRQGQDDRSHLRRQRRSQRCSSSAACWCPSAAGPNSDGLGLEKTKVQIDKQGFVAVDAQRRTAEPHIWAIGDVAGQPMLAHKAAHEGKTAVEAIAGSKVAFEPRAIPAVVFTDPEIAWAGLTETEAKAQGRTVEVAQFPWAASGRAQSVGRTEGLTKWLIDPASQRVVGCGIVGDGAGDLIAEAVLAIEMGCHRRPTSPSRSIPIPRSAKPWGLPPRSTLGTATDLYRPCRG